MKEREKIFRWLLLLTLIVSKNLFGSFYNDTSDLVRYTTDFKFTDGIFINFNQVKQNDPIEKSSILTTVDYDNPDFFEIITGNKEIIYYDRYGVKQTLNARKIWGYSRNGVLYVNVNNSFHRVTVVGSACHFIANITTYNSNYYDPYYYNNYYGYYRYGNRPSSYPTTEMRQYIIDFKTGRIMEYNYESVEVILMNDPQLHDEYAALRKKKKKQLKFLYLRKYNERNPIYFPKNIKNF